MKHSSKVEFKKYEMKQILKPTNLWIEDTVEKKDEETLVNDKLTISKPFFTNEVFILTFLMKHTLVRLNIIGIKLKNIYTL